ncbi:DAR GTPase 2, mitochondrial [Andrographis paniculata]|uniref:DAR GTPase 2, mitochondrial n=1 Tax=Andrographis paniculata TaxID=175694 RepID=UPI0021E770A6|nr:DAR GTPase 2, mitochondrial [Andrographis paniculata]
MDALIQRIGRAVKEAARSRRSDWWYTPHMAAASRAIADRLRLVDIVLEVRDARIPLSSECPQLRKLPSSTRRLVVLNKIDLANPSWTKEWMTFFEEQKWMVFGVNSHNRENIRKFLTFLQARVRELEKTDDLHRTITLMLVGIPNVGKSALANSLHQVGRISAAEKGRLRRSVVSPHPGETKNITSLKIASHPSVYVLDTPGVLPPYLTDNQVGSKLALTGAIKDSLVGEINLARYFLSVLSSSDEYKKWENLNLSNGVLANEGSPDLGRRQRRQLQTDHTQDAIVNGVRRALYETISSSSFSGHGEEDLSALMKVFHVESSQPNNSNTTTNNNRTTAIKLLNLFRTGRLGHYTLDHLPTEIFPCVST